MWTEVNADKLELLNLTQLRDRELVQSLAERVFGSGDRPKDWFTRKLEREAIDNDMSFVAADTRGVAPQSACENPDGWYGMVLVSAPASRPGTAHCATLGVLRHLQGRGVGARLIDAAMAQARRAGLRRMEAMVEPALVAYYQSLGFTSQRVLRTMLAFGRKPMPQAEPETRTQTQTSSDTTIDASFEATTKTASESSGDTLPPAEPWCPDDLSHYVELCGWLAEAWECTPKSECNTIRGEHWCAHTSVEGKSRLVHRLLVARDIDRAKIQVTASEELLDAIPAGQPVLVYGCDARMTRTLNARGWVTVQTGTQVEREL